MSYKDLLVWKLAKSLALDTYRITNTFPEKERFGLISQMTRAAISVPSNIAEGTSRSSLKDQARFVEIAYGSLMELSCQIEISYELGYIDQKVYNEFNTKAENLAVRLSNYRKSKNNC